MLSISFTETNTQIITSPSTGAWTDYNMNTNHSIPVSRVCVILMLNKEGATSTKIGVRINGSALSRYVELHEAEEGGATSVIMHVQLDASGILEYWTDSTNVEFWLLGYYGSTISYTELWVNRTPSDINWQDNQTVSVASRVIEFIGWNQDQTAAGAIGVRPASSSSDPSLSLHESESIGTTPVNALNMYSDSNASSYVDMFVSSITNCRIYEAGYFSSNVSFIEGTIDFTSLITNVDQWIAVDVTAGYVGAVLLTICMHDFRTGEEDLGASTNGGASTRYHLFHEAESNGGVGAIYPTLVNNSGQIYLYSGVTGASGFAFFGEWGFLYDNTISSSSSSSKSSSSSSSKSSSSSSSAVILSSSSSSKSSFSSSSSKSSSSSSSKSSSSSSSSKSSSSSSSKSSSSSSSMTPGWTWGEATPVGHTAEEWPLWTFKESETTARNTGDYGKIQLYTGEEFVSPVKDLGSNSIKFLVITFDEYASGFGSFSIEWRGSATIFTQDADEVSGPAWEEYITGTNKAWRYVQVKITGV